MLFLNKFTTLALFVFISKGNGYSFMDSTPFNISDCNQCITDINNVRRHNKV